MKPCLCCNGALVLADSVTCPLCGCADFGPVAPASDKPAPTDPASDKPAKPNKRN